MKIEIKGEKIVSKEKRGEMINSCVALYLFTYTSRVLFLYGRARGIQDVDSMRPLLTLSKTDPLSDNCLGFYRLLMLGKSESVVFRIYVRRLTCGSRHVSESFDAAPLASNIFTHTHTAARAPHAAAAEYADHECHKTRKSGASPAGV